MHEYSLMQDIIKSILERLQEEQSAIPVKEVVLKLGVLDIHSEAAARQAFEILTKDTPLQNSQLTVVVKPVMLECPKCRSVAPYPVDEHTHAHELLPVVVCPVCDGLAKLSGGQGVESIELVFEEEGSSVNL
jgi:hydrogenase nickel insertion protein HypA